MPMGVPKGRITKAGRIREFLKNNPLATSAELYEALGKYGVQANDVYHVRRRMREESNHTPHGPPEGKVQRVREYLEKHPEATPAEIREALGSEFTYNEITRAKARRAARKAARGTSYQEVREVRKLIRQYGLKQVQEAIRLLVDMEQDAT